MARLHSPDRYPPYGELWLMRPRQAREALGIGGERLRDIKPDMHRLELGSGTEFFSRGFVEGLAYEMAQRQERRSAVEVARKFKDSDIARSLIDDAEDSFEVALQRSLHTEADEPWLSAMAVAGLLGVSRDTINNWAEEDMINHFRVTVEGVEQFAFPEQAFRQFYAWRQPQPEITGQQ